MILLHSACGVEEHKKHNDATSSDPYLSERKKHSTPFKITEQKYTNIDDHPSVYTTL